MNYNFDHSKENQYEDILYTQWPQPETKASSSGRQPMDLNQRAKIFLPFAALKGFEEEIARRQKAAIDKIENPPKSSDFESFED